MDLPSSIQEDSELNIWEKLVQECRNELEQAKAEAKEVATLIDQSQQEVSRLQQRNASISARIQQFQTKLESVSSSDLRATYDSALEAQQRLFVTRGQIEKLQSDRNRLDRNIGLLEHIVRVLESTNFPQEDANVKKMDVVKTVEMIIQAQEAERGRLARKMHDGPAQALSNFILQTEIAMRMFDGDHTKAKEELSVVKSMAGTTFQKVRDFIFDLRPMMLDDLGLVPTITRYVESFKEQAGIEVRLITTGMEQRFESYIEVMVFRAMQELLVNISPHSQATNVIVQMDSSPNGLRVSIEDNGKGFEVDKIEEKGGMGLKVIRDRVQMLGGKFEIHSTLGQGTHILFQIPTLTTTAFA